MGEPPHDHGHDYRQARERREFGPELSSRGLLGGGNIEEVRAQGALGEASGIYISLEGQVVWLELNERIGGLNLREMRRIPLRVGVSRGAPKDPR